MTTRFLKTLLAASVPVVIVAALFAIYIFSPVQPLDPRISIEKGTPLRIISNRLGEKGIVKFPLLFLAYAELSRKGKDLKAGEYLFEQTVSPRQVLDRLAKGLVEADKIRIIEGWTLNQIADTLKNGGEIVRLAKDPAFIASLNLKTPTLEGYLFPETYYLETNAAPADYLKAFVKEFEKNYSAEIKELKTLPAYSKHQIMTLASIIEKETGSEAERNIIASVFYNRLAKGMPLQSDPTIIYGLKHFDGDIRKADITSRHPYNTYVHAGLPPGPICNPGLPSIKAALQPAQTDYLYFVSKGDGTHYFSRTSTEHAEAVRKYQLKQ